MISYKELLTITEAKQKSITFIFGRMNPPTKGHAAMIKSGQSFAKKNGTDYEVYPSATQEKKKNPLDIKTKIKFLKKFFKGVTFKSNPKLKNAFQIIDDLIDNRGYDKIYFVVGGDRVKDFAVPFKKYYEDKVEVINSGERVAGVSATDLRNAAKADDFETFFDGMPPTAKEADAKALFAAVQKGLG